MSAPRTATPPLTMKNIPHPGEAHPLAAATFPLPTLLLALALSIAIIPLTVAMILLPLGGLLMPAFGSANLLVPRLYPAFVAAITIPAIAG
jgi:hypothetical protein